jgi:hypothetical protein
VVILRDDERAQDPELHERGFYWCFAKPETALWRRGVSFAHGSHRAIPRSKEAQMKARTLILAVVGSLVLGVSPAYAGRTAVILSGGGSPVTGPGRAPTAIAHKTKPAKITRPTMLPWEAPNHSQVARNSF